MFRKSLHLALILLFLVPALTGWAGGDCCPDRDNRSGTDGNPAHEQALCDCATCQLQGIGNTIPTLGPPSPIGTLVPQDSEDPSNAHLSEIYRPPLV